MERLLLVVALGVVALAVAALIRSRTRLDAPTRPTWAVPDQVDRADFARPGAPWLVAVFSSATCLACQATWEKARPLESDDVAVQDVDAVADDGLHRRYGVDAVPMLLIAGPDGRVRASFLGEPPTADLWAAVADLRAAPRGPGARWGATGRGLTTPEDQSTEVVSAGAGAPSRAIRTRRLTVAPSTVSCSSRRAGHQVEPGAVLGEEAAAALLAPRGGCARPPGR